ncbi:MAG TPA: NADH-quinone oxidoreductase subunit I [Actinomycetota bacterium]
MTKEERQAKIREVEHKILAKKGIGAAYGLAKGLSITLRTMLRPAVTQQYPHVKPDLPPRTRGIIALQEENCTVCMLCARECPDWCIYIDSHKDVMPPKTPGARARTRNVLDRFAIDYALCMYCGICVEVCPFDALFWSPHFEYSTTDIDELTHEMDTLGKWMDLVPLPPPLEEGAEDPKEIAAEDKAYDLPAAAPAAAAAPTPADTAAPAPAAAAAPAEAPAQGAPAPVPAEAPTSAEAPPPAEAPAKPERHEEEPPQIDQETYDRHIAAGKSDREARALAKKAWILKRRQQG